ncbi:MAG: hypothetical protein P8X89_04835 [Reinekea sp.]
MFPKNFNEPTGAPAIFEKQIEIKLLHPAKSSSYTLHPLKKSRIQVSYLFFSSRNQVISPNGKLLSR